MSDDIHGPDAYWSSELPPSRGQYAAIAKIALDLMGEEIPTTRLDATIAIAKLRKAQLDAPVRPKAADPF